MKFRKKPVVIEAVRVADILDAEAPDDLPVWVEAAVQAYTLQIIPTTGTIHIRTPEGVMRGGRTDWLIKGVSNELYPCKPDIFDATYEPVTE